MSRQRPRRKLRGHRGRGGGGGGRGRRHLALPPVSTIPPGPINLHQHTACNLCNENIYSFSTTDIAELIYHNSPKDAEGFSNGPWIHGRSTDMDDVHFDEMWTWSCMLRALFFTMYDDVSSFHLSGVGELQPTHQLSLPQNENDMILCNHQSDNQHGFPNPNFVSELAYSVAFPMHERCWKLMTRMLDIDLIKKNMDIFLHAMCDPYDVIRPLLDSTGTYPVWLEWFKLLDSLASGLYLNPQKFCATADAIPSHMPPEFRGADPLNDPCLNDVITKYTTKYTMQRKMGFEPRSQPSIPTHPMSRLSQARFTTRNVFLPTELILNIADHLDNHEDIHALLLVFPNWHPMIPNSYWRRRFIDDNCLCSDEFPAVDAMDWQRVYLSGQSSTTLVGVAEQAVYLESTRQDKRPIPRATGAEGC